MFQCLDGIPCTLHLAGTHTAIQRTSAVLGLGRTKGTAMHLAISLDHFPGHFTSLRLGRLEVSAERHPVRSPLGWLSVERDQLGGEAFTLNLGRRSVSVTWHRERLPV